jgi:hypothetical protein
MATATQLKVEYRYILRTREGKDITHPDGQPLVWPTYTAALRGRAMIDCTAHIIQQEREVLYAIVSRISGDAAAGAPARDSGR